jgi:adenylate kinase
VLVLRAETSVLFDRLTSRGYSDEKRSENIECEIMQICLEEAMESYDTTIVNELPSNTLEDLENSIGKLINTTFALELIFSS